jgi:ATP-dependent DNA helicase RecG
MASNKPKLVQIQFDFEVQTKPEQLMSADEIFENADEALLKRLKEDRRIERKPSGYSGSNLGEYICMWANTPPEGGLIAIGILDDGSIEGCKHLSIEHLNKVEKTAYTFCPDASCQNKRISVYNKTGESDFIVLFRVKYNHNIVVKTTSGKVYIRRGDSKNELKSDREIRELQSDKGEIDLEQETCDLSWPEDFNEKYANTFAETVKNVRNISPNLTTEEVLVLRRLGKNQSGKYLPNYACLLLFAKDPIRVIPGCKIHFQKFEGEQEGTGDKYNAVKDIILEGTIPDLIQQVEGVLESQLRTFSPLDSKGKFYPIPEYPKAAWYEAVVNACVHRSYGNGMKNIPIFVKLFDDRLVVESPGPFPPFVTPDNIYDMHHPRNPMLMDAMFYLEYVKCAHEGTRRMRDTMAEMRLPVPEFSQKQSNIGNAIVRVTLRNNIKQRRAWIDRDVSKIVSEAIASAFSEMEIRAVNWVAEHGKITISDANKILNISWPRAQKLLLDLTHRKVFQYIRFRQYGKDKRDPKAYFRLRSNEPLPEGAFEQTELEKEE